MKSALVIVAFVAALLGALVGSAVTTHGQIGLTIMPDKLRFRVIGDEPIATPDVRGVVSGMKVIVLRDSKSDQCYVMFAYGAAMSTTGPSACP
jgi:hypothetical protein